MVEAGGNWMRISRRDATSEQIDQAIHAFFTGLTASPVTLAGAAEASLPDVDVFMLSVMKTMGSQRGLSENEVVHRVNEVRDWLKHRKPEVPKMEIREEDAVGMILRAYTKFVAVFGKDAATPLMRKFEEWFRGNYQHWL